MYSGGFDVINRFDCSGQFAFQRAQHLQINNIMADARRLRLVENFITDDAAGVDRFGQLYAQFQCVGNRNVDFRAVFV